MHSRTIQCKQGSLYSSGSRQVPIVSVETPFWQTWNTNTLWSSCDFQEMEPPLATHLRKLLLWLTLACVREVVWNQIDWSFAQNDWSGRVHSKMGVASQNLCALHAQLLENPLRKSWLRPCTPAHEQGPGTVLFRVSAWPRSREGEGTWLCDYIVAKCPGLARIVPVFGPMSRFAWFCSILPESSFIAQNNGGVAQA